MTKRCTSSNIDDTNTNLPNNKRIKMAGGDGGEGVTWGEWMGSYKTGSLVDNESERMDRQKAAFGGETIARLKDLNVLIIGMQ